MYKILVVEPYYGGSHRQFLNGLQQNISADFTLLTLPARKWKMRMQTSAPWFAELISGMANTKFDTVLCSTFVDVAVLKALLTKMKGWNENCLFCTYFHENQFAYPTRIEDKAMHQFTGINFTTALVSDRIAFNSEYNLATFHSGLSNFMRKAADVDLSGTLTEIKEKSRVIYPGFDYGVSAGERGTGHEIPVICWNHRWEHDKNPEEFFRSMAELAELGYDFKLVVLGQSFQDEPEIFSWARDRFSSNILHFGYVSSREEYFTLLGQCDIVVSTAHHEFFGLSVMEAVGAGCIPVVPDRLSYPELYPGNYLYGSNKLTEKLVEVLNGVESFRLPLDEIHPMQYSWAAVKKKYANWLMT